MRSYLNRFKYDLFISHAWFGNQDPLAGDRAWAEQLQRRLEIDLREQLTDNLSVFFDSRDASNGDVNNEFRRDVEESALFVAIVTPAFCRPDCFCLKELDWFSTGAKAVSAQPMDIARRMFRVASRPLAPSLIPRQLRNSLTYNFFEGDPQPPYLQFERYPISAVDTQLSSQIRRSYQSLLNQLAGLLDDCRQAQANHPIRRIFLAETTCIQRAQMPIELSPHEVVSVPYLPGMSADELAEKTSQELLTCDRSVHLVDASAPLIAPAENTISPLDIQLQCALKVKKPGFRASVWCDPSVPLADGKLADWIGTLWTRFPEANSLEYIDKGFQYLLSNLKRECSDPSPQKPPAPLAEGKLLYVQCIESDKPKLLDVIRELRDNNVQVRFQMKAPKKSLAEEVQRFNQGFLQRAEAALYYWGTDHAPGMYADCDKAAASEAAAGKPLLMGLDPHELLREVDAHPGYTVIPFPADKPRDAVRSLFSQLPGGGN